MDQVRIHITANYFVMQTSMRFLAVRFAQGWPVLRVHAFVMGRRSLLQGPFNFNPSDRSVRDPHGLGG